MANRFLTAVRKGKTIYIADARNGKIGTFASRSGAQKFLKRNGGGKIIVQKRR